MKILAFAASNSKKSINKLIISYVEKTLNKDDVEILDINDYEMPIYSADFEEAHGVPTAAKRFLEKIKAADALVISFAEHNGGYSVAYKNLFDWASREHLQVYQDKPVVMLSTSPGKGGAKHVLAFAVNSASRFGGHVVAFLSIPSFEENFDREKGTISNSELQVQFVDALSKLSPQGKIESQQ